MERCEPTLVPEWLKDGGSLPSTLHSDDNAGLKLARNKSSVNRNGHDLSFNRNHRDRDREKNAYDFRDKEKSGFGDHWCQDFSDPLAKILSSSFERDGLRRSQWMVSGKCGENWPKKLLIYSRNASGNNSNGLVITNSPTGSVNKAAFERDFPSLGAEERSAAPDI